MELRVRGIKKLNKQTNTPCIAICEKPALNYNSCPLLWFVPVLHVPPKPSPLLNTQQSTCTRRAKLPSPCTGKILQFPAETSQTLTQTPVQQPSTSCWLHFPSTRLGGFERGKHPPAGTPPVINTSPALLTPGERSKVHTSAHLEVQRGTQP